MMNILLIANEYTTIVNFRLELIDALVKNGYNVTVAVPEHERNSEIKALGCDIINIHLTRKGMNALREFKSIREIFRILKLFHPDIVLTFTIKPNIYGGIVCTNSKIPYISNITGLGTAIENEGIVSKITRILYKAGLRGSYKVFFQNTENRDFMISHHIYNGLYEMIPGSGVNLEKYSYMKYPESDLINFAFIARVIKEKGIDQYFEAASFIRRKYPFTRFHIYGECEGKYEEQLKDMQDKGIVIYHGMIDDMTKIYKTINCTVHPTYYPEGMSNVLLESAASGRPIITTDRAGCREIIDEGINGFIVKQKDSDDLIEKLEKFLDLSWDEKMQMGLAGRRKVEREFDRQIVVRKYLEEVRGIYELQENH